MPIFKTICTITVIQNVDTLEDSIAFLRDLSVGHILQKLGVGDFIGIPHIGETQLVPEGELEEVVAIFEQEAVLINQLLQNQADAADVDNHYGAIASWITSIVKEQKCSELDVLLKLHRILLQRKLDASVLTADAVLQESDVAAPIRGK